MEEQQERDSKMQQWLDAKMLKAAKEKKAKEDEIIRIRNQEEELERQRIRKEKADRLAEQVKKAVDSKKMSLSMRKNRNAKESSHSSTERVEKTD